LIFVTRRSKCVEAIRGYSIEEEATRGDSGNCENLTNLKEAHKVQGGKFTPKEDRGIEEGREGSDRENSAMAI